MQARATRQYWEGYVDGVRDVANLLRKVDSLDETQHKRIIEAIDIKARSVAINKLGEQDNVEHA